MPTERDLEKDAIVERAVELCAYIENLEDASRKTIWSILIFAIIGIFFFPCLIISGLCIFLYFAGTGKVRDSKTELEKIRAIPNIQEYAKWYDANPKS